MNFNLPSMPDMSGAMRAIQEKNMEEALARQAAISSVKDNLASKFVERLLVMINDFERGLQPDQEIGVKLVSFGQSIVIHVSGIGYSDPSLVRFAGNLEGSGAPVELIQHVSQISFLLMAVPALTPEEPKRRIGYIQD